MENSNKPNQGVQLELNPELAKGVYSNLAVITHSHSEFIVDFASSLPGFPKPSVVSRVVMTPENAKSLLRALQENVVRYEQRFGTIQNGVPQGNGTIAPFGNGKGEA